VSSNSPEKSARFRWSIKWKLMLIIIILVISLDDPGIKFRRATRLPAGPHIELNLKKARTYGLHYEEMALGSINQIIE